MKIEGRTPRNGFEWEVYNNLFERGVDFSYESKVIPYESPVIGARCPQCKCKVTKPRKYTPDFVIIRSDDTKLYVEAKGRFPSQDRSKMRDVGKSNGHLDIRILFDPRRSAKQKEDLAKWCNKNGFDFAFGREVPPTWLL